MASTSGISRQFDGSNLFRPLTTAAQADGELSAFAYELRLQNLYSRELMTQQAFLLIEKLEQNDSGDAAEYLRGIYLTCYQAIIY